MLEFWGFFGSLKTAKKERSNQKWILHWLWCLTYEVSIESSSLSVTMQLNLASSGHVHVSLNSSSEGRQREVFIYNRRNISWTLITCLSAPHNLVQALTVIYSRAAMKEQVTGHKAVIPFQIQVNFLLLCLLPLDARTLFKMLSWAIKSILSFPFSCQTLAWMLSLLPRLPTYISFLVVFQLQNSPWAQQRIGQWRDAH